ncbi:hypothetical protein B0H19DRAFT_333775 [Mycena capillaripes]|nr:hypothetical protein B0H19DRAFT_333775 [Mycena capillaripes]
MIMSVIFSVLLRPPVRPGQCHATFHPAASRRYTMQRAPHSDSGGPLAPVPVLPCSFRTASSLCALLWPPLRPLPACQFPSPSSERGAQSPPSGTPIGMPVCSAIHGAAGPSCASRLRTISATFRPFRRPPACAVLHHKPAAAAIS